MKNKVALLVIYNHRYDKNISVVERLYSKRFSNIFHIMPFYDGEESNVISVFESSYYFQGYIAQAYQHLKDKGFTHYYIIADDLLLNPLIDENNLWDVLGLDSDECMFTDFLIMQERSAFWGHAQNALDWNVIKPGVEIANLLPSYDDAKSKFSKFNLPVGEITEGIIDDGHARTLKEKVYSLIKKRKTDRMLKYPLVGGYSDTFLITADVMPSFSHYCGFFSATHLFVELAVPTAIVLSAEKVKLEKDLRMKGEPIWDGLRLSELEREYKLDLNNLINNFPENTLYLHPIKLSKWFKS